MNVPDRSRGPHPIPRAAGFPEDAVDTEDPPPPRVDDPASRSVAQRRQLTIMFCDIVGSTALSSRLDPEDLSAVIGGYQSRVAATIARFGGFIARYVGDGILIYFGWPITHEANAERAVRAALAVIEAIGQTSLATGALQVRIGIATGLVVVGETIGTGEARQQTAIGETPNLAARLQGLAEPDGVVIDAVTRRQIGDLFECRDLGSVAMKGLLEPVPAWQVLKQAGVGSRSEALLSAAFLLPVVGREDEIALLLDCWVQAKGGQGRVVLLSGEAGIGKSRLAAGLMERLAAEPHTALHYFCSPQHQDSPLFPIIAQIERTAAFTGSDSPDNQLMKLKALLGGESAQDEDVALIVELMGLGNGSGLLPAPGRRERLLGALAGQLAALAARQPVVMLFEDTHWIDPTSLELLHRMVGLIRYLPVLLVISFRPEFRSAWAELPHVVSLALGGLGRRDAMKLAVRTAGATPLSPTVIKQIIERTEGVPLFIEELTRAIVEADWHDTMIAKAVLGPALPGCAIPAALYASLAARLDQLATVREVAQVAAVIGREFSFDLLAAVIPPLEGTLEEALIRLTEADLISPHDVNSGAGYAFRHALIRDVAYSTLLRDRRRQLHAQVAEALRQHFPEQVERVPELLARHYALAGLIEPAVRHLLAAGRLAFRASAYHEADSHLRRGSELLDRLPEGAPRTRLKLDLRAALSLVRDASRGYSHMFQPMFATWRWDGRQVHGKWPLLD